MPRYHNPPIRMQTNIKLVLPKADEDAEPLESLYIVSGHKKLYGHLGKYSFL